MSAPKQRKTCITLLCAEASATYEGGAELVIVGRTERGVSHRITIRMAPSSVGYLAFHLRGALDTLQQRITVAYSKFGGS